jgi:hypothetical protein
MVLNEDSNLGKVVAIASSSHRVDMEKINKLFSIHPIPNQIKSKVEDVCKSELEFIQ